MATTARRSALAWYQKIFGEENFYIEIQNNGVDIQRDLPRGDRPRAAIGVAAGGAPATRTILPARMPPAHDVLLCINTGTTVDDPDRMKFETDPVLRP